MIIHLQPAAERSVARPVWKPDEATRREGPVAVVTQRLLPQGRGLWTLEGFQGRSRIELCFK